jgi:hypothetical protein
MILKKLASEAIEDHSLCLDDLVQGIEDEG